MHPITSPTPIPTNIVFFALFSLPAPTFCETNDAIDCISELGMSIAKLTILHATPYPDDACNPSLLTNAHKARNEICVRNSCNASGSPTFNALLQCLLIEKSFLVILNGSFLLKVIQVQIQHLPPVLADCHNSSSGSIHVKPCNKNKVTYNINNTCNCNEYKR